MELIIKINALFMAKTQNYRRFGEKLKKMTIEKNKVVVLTYQLSVKDQTDTWESIETVEADEPMAFIHGLSGLPELFENNLLGLSTGDSFDFKIPSEDGYGDYEDEAVVELPLDIFKVEGELQSDILVVGNVVPMSNEDGHQMMGQVLEVAADHVVMDFNHPLAGREMWFKGSVLEVREATHEELEHGHVHGLGGIHH